jgi:hypothetical protein
MTDAVYRCLVRMHPPSFRREFGGEMLWIYGEAAKAEGVVPLFIDGFVSLARQWFLRSGYWKFAVALSGAFIQVTLGGALMFRIGPSPAHSSLSVLENPEMAALLHLAAAAVICLLAAVMVLVLWWRKLALRTGA